MHEYYKCVFVRRVCFGHFSNGSDLDRRSGVQESIQICCELPEQVYTSSRNKTGSVDNLEHDLHSIQATMFFICVNFTHLRTTQHLWLSLQFGGVPKQETYFSKSVCIFHLAEFIFRVDRNHIFGGQAEAIFRVQAGTIFLEVSQEPVSPYHGWKWTKWVNGKKRPILD